jgi:uncharacterized protein with NAD-binding domain and iron-sulfur cluster
MAGLTAAWALSAPECRDEYEITVFERQWCLGGKGASTRAGSGRIEEHGLHVWLGYYDNAFRLMREVYGELDRRRRDPRCPIASWRDAFLPSGRVGVQDDSDGSWSHWMANFGENPLEPGLPSGPAGEFAVLTLLERGLRLLVDFSASLEEPSEPQPAGVVMSASGPALPRRASTADLTAMVRRLEIAGLVGALQAVQVVRGTVPGLPTLVPSLLAFLDRVRDDLLARVRRDRGALRSWQLADLVIACLRGTLADRLALSPAGFASIDHLDWLQRHGAAADTLGSPLLRGLYDLVFAYEEGDASRPRFSAGLGLFLSAKLFFDYKGSIFWKLRAGMGDVVFAPLFQALRERGVRFAFAHRVTGLHLDGDGRSIAACSLDADPDGRDADPLVRVRGLPCFPAREPRGPAEPRTLRRGEDYDELILATPPASHCAELTRHSAQWREMTRRVATVGTQSLQLWMHADERRLGWMDPGATVSGYLTPFDTYASMSHTLDLEDWDEPEAPRAVGYFCSALPDGGGPDAVRANVDAFLDGPIRRFWPGYAPELVAARYLRANVDPSERYVQSLPDTARWRLRADGSGYEHLFLAGDWTDCGLNAGCVEAAVLSGLEAANAVRRRPLLDGVLGSWCALGGGRQ